MPAEVDETHSHMKPVDVLETFNMAQYVTLSENSVGWERNDVFRVKFKFAFPVVQTYFPDYHKCHWKL